MTCNMDKLKSDGDSEIVRKDGSESRSAGNTRETSQITSEVDREVSADEEPLQQTSEMIQIKPEVDLLTNPSSEGACDNINDKVTVSNVNNLQEEAGSNISVTTPQAKTNKRGRKKKSDAVSPNENSEKRNVTVTENELSVTSEVAVGEPKIIEKKRGRKKKEIYEESTSNPTGLISATENMEDANVKPTPVKGKGMRKEKSATNSENPEEFILPTNDNELDDEIIVPQRKFARKKAAAVLDSEDSDNDFVVSTLPGAKRKPKRGASTICNDDDGEDDSLKFKTPKRRKTQGRAAAFAHFLDDSDDSFSTVQSSKRKKKAVEDDDLQFETNNRDTSSCGDQAGSENINLNIDQLTNDSQTNFNVQEQDNTDNVESVTPAKGRTKNKKAPEAPLSDVKCASCQKEIPGKEFSKHNIDTHNNLAWIEGEEPLDLNDEKLVNKLLKHALAKGRRKKLVCELCGAEKKSVVGFVSHRTFCGNTGEQRENLLVACELCGRKVMPVSVKAHMSIHERPERGDDPIGAPEESGRKRAAATKAKSRMTEFLHDDPLGLTNSAQNRKTLLYSPPNEKKKALPPRTFTKWRAALKENNVAQCINANCSFEANSLEAMKTHYYSCEFTEKTQGLYSCALCIFKCEDEVGIQEHITIAHPWSNVDVKSGPESESEVEIKLEEESVSGEEESDEEKGRFRLLYPRTKKLCHRYRFLAIEDPGKSGLLDTYSPTLMWTLKFRLDNDSKALFSEFHTTEKDWELIDANEVGRYLPATETSMYTSFDNLDSGVRFNLFQSKVIDDMSTMFVGGPIWSCAWCPLPLSVSLLSDVAVSQFLAVSCHREMDEFHTVNPCFVGPNIIQIWDCGVLKNSESPVEPKLALAIAHEYGTIWRMEWCPSGAYGCSGPGTLLRMGLLAAACSDGCVHIFSVCFPNQLLAHERENRAPVYRAEPVLTLRSNAPDPSQCMRLSWCRSKGHGFIAAGFCDGKVALWNLENFSTLLFDKENRELYPYHAFQAHLSIVSAVSLSPEGRYMMTGSHDCSVKFWDLEDTTTPITVNRRGLVTDGVWLSHWVAGMAAYDDALLQEHTNATVVSFREYGFKPFPAIPQNSVAWCISESPWLNSIVQGTMAGEVALNIAGQLFSGLDNEKNIMKKRLLVSVTEQRELVKNSDGSEKLGSAMEPPETPRTPAKSTSKSAKPGKGAKPKTPEPPKSPECTTSETLQRPEKTDPLEQNNGTGEPTGVDSDMNTSDIDLNLEQYKDTSEKFGIKIVNFVKFKANNIPAEATQPMRQSNFMQSAHADKYPITSINQVQWNPNMKSCLWLAIGHQSGLLRLVCLEFMHTITMDRFISKAETLVEKFEAKFNASSDHYEC